MITTQGIIFNIERLKSTYCPMPEADFKLILETIKASSEASEPSLAIDFSNHSLQPDQFKQLQEAIEVNSALHSLALSSIYYKFPAKKDVQGEGENKEQKETSELGNILANLISKKTTLCYLKLSGCFLTRADIEAIAKALPMGQLLVLNLPDCNIDYIGAEKIAASLPRTQIVTLDLSNNPLQNKGAEAIFRALSRSLVRELKVSNCSIVETFHDDSLWHGGNYGTTEGHVKLDKVFEGLKKNGLVVLDLSENSINDKGAALIAGTLCLNQLVKLVLRECGIEDEGVKALARVFSESLLGDLNLSNNIFGNLGASFLFNELPGSQIHSLDVSENTIRNSGDDEEEGGKNDANLKRSIIAALQLPQLRRLNLRNTNVGIHILDILCSGITASSGICHLDLRDNLFYFLIINDPVKRQILLKTIQTSKLHTVRFNDEEDLLSPKESVEFVLSEALIGNQKKVKAKVDNFKLELSGIREQSQEAFMVSAVKPVIRITSEGGAVQEFDSSASISKANETLFQKIKMYFYQWQILYFDEDQEAKIYKELEAVLWQALSNVLPKLRMFCFARPYVWILESLDAECYSRLHRVVDTYRDEDDLRSITKLLGRTRTTNIVCGPLRRTPIHCAAAQGKAAVLAEVLKSCFQVKDEKNNREILDIKTRALELLNKQDMNGDTAFHLAVRAKRGSVIIGLLLQYGMSGSVKNNAGQTVRDIADPETIGIIDEEVANLTQEGEVNLIKYASILLEDKLNLERENALLKKEHKNIKRENAYLANKLSDVENELKTLKESVAGQSKLEQDKKFLKERHFTFVNGCELFLSMSKNPTTSKAAEVPTIGSAEAPESNQTSALSSPTETTAPKSGAETQVVPRNREYKR